MFLSASVWVCMRARKCSMFIFLSLFHFCWPAFTELLQHRMCAFTIYLYYIRDRHRLFTFSFFMFCNTPTSSIAHSFFRIRTYSIYVCKFKERGSWRDCVRVCVTFLHVARLRQYPYCLSRFPFISLHLVVWVVSLNLFSYVFWKVVCAVLFLLLSCCYCCQQCYCCCSLLVAAGALTMYRSHLLYVYTVPFLAFSRPGSNFYLAPFL